MGSLVDGDQQGPGRRPARVWRRRVGEAALALRRDEKRRRVHLELQLVTPAGFERAEVRRAGTPIEAPLQRLELQVPRRLIARVERGRDAEVAALWHHHREGAAHADRL